MDTTSAQGGGLDPYSFLFNFLTNTYFTSGYFWGSVIVILAVIAVFRIYVYDNKKIPFNLPPIWAGAIFLFLILLVIWLFNPVKFEFTKKYFADFLGVLSAVFIVYGLVLHNVIKKISANLNKPKEE